jgi:hypothetical protein
VIRRKKNMVRLGFSGRRAAVVSQEAMVAELDQQQREWESENPNFVASEIKDDIWGGRNCVVGGICWAGYRFFSAVPHRALSKS